MCALRICKKDYFDFRSFRGLLGEKDLHYARIAPPFAPMIRYAAFFWNNRPKQQTIDVSGSRCLATIMRSSRHCMPLVGQIRRSACDIVGPRTTARNATRTKTTQRNKAYISLFFWYYICNTNESNFSCGKIQENSSILPCTCFFGTYLYFSNLMIQFLSISKSRKF